jgi:hypothetical protein
MRDARGGLKSGRSRAGITLRPMPASPPAGLCNTCRHQRVVPNTRGSVFSLCRRSKEDDRYPRYPRLPVISCPGHEPGTGDEEQADG